MFFVFVLFVFVCLFFGALVSRGWYVRGDTTALIGAPTLVGGGL